MSLIFRPPQTKKELNEYIETFTGVRFSENLVDPESTCSQLDALWEVYETMLTNKQGPKSFVTVVSRNGCKTLMGSILAYLGLVIFRRHIVIMSATKAQSEAMINYIDQHFRKSPEIEPFCNTDNRTTKEVQGLPFNTYTKTLDYAKCVVVAATPKGANSQRASLLLLDELDLVDQKIIAEVSGVLDPTRDEHNFEPVTVALSSRKAAKGPIQAAIDKCEKQPHLWKLLKWSVADLLEPCPYSKEHKQEMPKPALMSQETLEVKYDATLEDIPELERDNWKQRNYYSNCKTCKRGLGFKFCQGLTVNSIPKDSKARRTLDFLLNVASNVEDTSVLVAQYLNWKPENKGTVFRTFNHARHTGNLEQIYRWAMNLSDGLKAPTGLTWNLIANVLQQNGYNIIVGIDYGYSPDPATAIFIAYNQETSKTIILKSLYYNEFSNQDWSNYVIAYCKQFGIRPDLFAPDHADGAAASYFSRHGLPVTKKKPSKINTGVSQIRGLLMHPLTNKIMFKILQDEEFYPKYIKEISTWQHAQNKITGDWDQERFEKGNDHGLDATRYALHIFTKSSSDYVVEADETTASDNMSGIQDHVRELEKQGNVSTEQFSQLTHQIQSEQYTHAVHKALEEQHGVVLNSDEDDDGDNDDCFFLF